MDSVYIYGLNNSNDGVNYENIRRSLASQKEGLENQMSRSVKKSPVFKDQQHLSTGWTKRQAGKAVRRFKGDVQNGKWYRKLYCPWNICDYRFYKTKQQAVHEWKTFQWLREQLLTHAEVINDWEKFYRRK